MIPFKNILCPTDFSEPSYKALVQAHELAAHFDATLHLLHVVPKVPLIPGHENDSEFDVNGYQRSLERSAKALLDELITNKDLSGVKIKLRVAHGDAAKETVKIAKKEKTDLIVISTHGMTGWWHLIFGSVAEKVVRLAPCPVLTVQQLTPEEY